ncbi:hypothetical protein UREG_03033 [Uncinocarpus reesii 1704]|uniref:Uncharacterized protein n=1 Tax=Uncinocarpus reesii (strain UAMH 1704) TaxID=336963 RepID=C4JNN5_UNCRE|nr:uncharacterized protein UREG_03033 [Uncinocarpus reesii 1704]EEP78188.1 hypothetical protein UREG_03033 [Uncinocarpus reesii 1704]
MASLPRRTTSLTRLTNETKVQISLSLDGGVLLPYEPCAHFPQTSPEEATQIVPSPESAHATQFTSTQQITISTGIGFLDHLLHALAKHAGWSLAIKIPFDTMHCFYPAKSSSTTPTLPKTLPRPGHRFTRALALAVSLVRFARGDAPLDEALSWAVIDISSRPYSVINLGLQREKVGALSTEMISHGLESFAQAAGVTLHVSWCVGEHRSSSGGECDQGDGGGGARGDGEEGGG